MFDPSQQIPFQFAMPSSGGSPASRTALSVSGLGQKTTGTCGPSSGVSLPKSDLGLSLAKMCQELIEQCLPTLSVTLKHLVTKSGCSVWRLLQSERRIDGKDGSLLRWPTASARDWKDTPGMSIFVTNKDGTLRTRADQLARAVYLAETGISASALLRNVTPMETDGALSETSIQQNATALDRLKMELSTSKKKMEHFGEGGLLNPAWVTNLMGFPEGWLDLDPEARGRLAPARKRGGKRRVRESK